MSLATLSQMIRALQHDRDLDPEKRGLVAQAYANSFAGTKPWMLSAKEQENIAVFFGELYEGH